MSNDSFLGLANSNMTLRKVFITMWVHFDERGLDNAQLTIIIHKMCIALKSLKKTDNPSVYATSVVA